MILWFDLMLVGWLMVVDILLYVFWVGFGILLCGFAFNCLFVCVDALLCLRLLLVICLVD